eukprot:tig00020902_g15052.t1
MLRSRAGKYLVGASHYVSRISDTSRAAANSYEALLRKYRSSKMLLRTYADFVASVLNDPERSHQLYLRADEIEEQEAARLGGGAANGGTAEEGQTEEGTGDGTSDAPDALSSQGGSSSQVKDGAGAAKKKKNRNDGFLNNEGQLKAVRRLHTGAATGLSILGVEVVCFYLISRLLLDKISGGLTRITDIASHARSVSSITDHARTLQLSASLNYPAVYRDELSRMQALADDFREAHRGLYFGRPGVPPSTSRVIQDLWNSPSIEYQVYLPDVDGGKPSRVQQKAGLWDLGALFYSRAMEFREAPAAEHAGAATNRAFRFIQDVGARQLTEVILQAALLYENEVGRVAFLKLHTALLGVTILQDRDLTFILLSAMVLVGLTTMFSTILLVPSAAIQPSIRRVQQTKSGVSDILNVIPRRALRKIARHYAKMRPPDVEESDQELGEEYVVEEDEDEDEGTENSTRAAAASAGTGEALGTSMRRMQLAGAGRRRSLIRRSQSMVNTKTPAAAQNSVDESGISMLSGAAQAAADREAPVYPLPSARVYPAPASGGSTYAWRQAASPAPSVGPAASVPVLDISGTSMTGAMATFYTLTTVRDLEILDEQNAAAEGRAQTQRSRDRTERTGRSQKGGAIEVPEMVARWDPDAAQSPAAADTPDQPKEILSPPATARSTSNPATALLQPIQDTRSAHMHAPSLSVDLLYGSPCLRADGDCSKATLDYLSSLVSHGLDFCIEQFVGFAQQALKENKAFTEGCDQLPLRLR